MIFDFKFPLKVQTPTSSQHDLHMPAAWVAIQPFAELYRGS